MLLICCTMLLLVIHGQVTLLKFPTLYCSLVALLYLARQHSLATPSYMARQRWLDTEPSVSQCRAARRNVAVAPLQMALQKRLVASRKTARKRWPNRESSISTAQNHIAVEGSAKHAIVTLPILHKAHT
jgi:hypothetical protein